MKSIIMSGNHPKLILDGIKTQTRRVIKPQPEPCDHLKVFGEKDANSQKPTVFFECGPAEWACRICGKGIKPISEFDVQGIKCPYGQVGDRLWVRETWATESLYNWTKPSEIPSGSRIFYLADGPDLRYAVGKTRPSIFMPRWASRITLEITEVRVERVQEISPIDCVAEGCPKYHEYNDKMECVKTLSPIEQYRELWDSLNAKRGYRWEVNPWVWVLSFKKC